MDTPDTFLDDEDIEQTPEDDAAAVATLIQAANEIIASLPLTAVMRPYDNPNAPWCIYRAVVLTDLFADQPGNGAGRIWLAAVGKLCDEADITLYTDAACTRSRDFYLANGFERTHNQQHQLVRWSPPFPGACSPSRPRRGSLKP